MIAMLVLVALVSFMPASAETLEVRGNVASISASNPELVWAATNFAAFWYDLDGNLQSEVLTLEAGVLNESTGDRTIDEGALIYTTYTIYQEYELHENEGLTVENGPPDGDTGYWIEGFMAEEYVAIDGNADKLSKLLVEFEDYDKKTLVTNNEWDLGGGFSLTANQINLSSGEVWFTLKKDDKELDKEVIATDGAHQDCVYTYTADIGNEEEIPVFSCYVDAIFRGTDSNIVQVMYVFLIDNEVLEIDIGDNYGIMEVMTASRSVVTLINSEVTLDLDADTKEQIMGNMYFRTADDDSVIRFYPMVEYTKPGTYKVRGSIVNLTGTSNSELAWNALNLGVFWYDLDNDLQSEVFTLEAGVLNEATDDRTIDEDALIYTTYAIYQEYELRENEKENENLTVESNNPGGDAGYWIEGWMGETYVAIDNNSDKLCKLILEFEDDDRKTLFTGEKWDLGGGFALELMDIADNGNAATLRLFKNGAPLDGSLKCISSNTACRQDCVYTYTADIGGEETIPVFSCYVDVTFKGDNIGYVQLMYAFLIDDNVLEIDTGDNYGIMEVMTASRSGVTLRNNDDPLDLDTDTTEHIMGDLYFKTADDDTAIRFYPFVERTIGEEPTPPPTTIPATDIDGDGVPDVWDADNSTLSGYWVNSEGIGRKWGDVNGDGKLTSADALMILQAAVENIELGS